MKPDLRNVTLWFADMERQLQEEADYPWWPQVLPLTSGVGMAAESARQLAQRLIASWIWTKQFKGPGLCPPVPSLLNIAQFLDEVTEHKHTEEEWLLAYSRVLQHVTEASKGCKWININPHPIVHTTDLVEAFMMATEVWHEVRDVARCWGEPPDLHPAQPHVQEFAQVMAHLDRMVMWVPSQRALDELVYPPYEPCNHHSCQYVVGVSWIWKSPCPRPRWRCMTMAPTLPRAQSFVPRLVPGL